jgi:hypothetical protein
VISEQTINVEFQRLLADLRRCDPNAVLLGVGLDIETNRLVDPEAARFYLTDREQEWLREQCGSASSQHLLRLWTVKEAIFKADPENNEKILGDYVLENPSHWAGSAYPKDRMFLRFYYSSIPLDEGFLSIAVLAKGERDA